MIRKFSHKNINKDKYTACLKQAVNYRIYAELGYLSIVSPEGYDILVLNDYEAVMPIPYQKKWGMKFVCQPVLCQQLGIFYPETISQEDFTLFFSCLKKYRVRSYNFNEKNTGYFPSVQEKRNNQILYLNQSYETIGKNFKKDKKELLKKKEIQDLHSVKGFHSTDLEYLQKENIFFYFSQDQFIIVKKHLSELNKRNLVKQYTVINKTGKKSVFLWTLESQNRIIILITARIKKNEFKGSLLFLINQIIKEFSNTDKILDFEGSMIPGVAWFNESLGAVTRQYITYKNFTLFEMLKKHWVS